jgi:excisionase family DNA binding protein
VTERQKRRGSQADSNPTEPDVSEPIREKRTDFLTARQLAEVLQVSESTIHRLRRSGRIPAIVLTGRLIRFNLRDVRSALKSIGRDVDSLRSESEPSPQLSFDDLSANFGSS